MHLSLKDNLPFTNVTVTYRGQTVEVSNVLVDNLKLGECSINDFEVEIGGMDYGFEINGILGMDFLLHAEAIINLRAMKIEFAR